MEYAFLLFVIYMWLIGKTYWHPSTCRLLVAGFLLNFAGYTLTEDLTQIANLGITIMLFTIGLKLNIRDLSRREVLGGKRFPHADMGGYNNLLRICNWSSCC